MPRSGLAFSHQPSLAPTLWESGEVGGGEAEGLLRKQALGALHVMAGTHAREERRLREFLAGPTTTVGTHTQLATENIDGNATGFSGFYAIWRLSEQVPNDI